MKSREARIIAACAAAVLASGSVLAQQAVVTRDFEADIQAALQAAKTAAGFEFLRHAGPNVSVAAERRRRHA